MDSLTLIAIASIVTAGLTIALGSIGPALGEGRAVATALSSLAQQPDAASTITRTLFVGLAMIESSRHLLLRGFDDSHLCKPVLESRDRPGWRKIGHAHRLVHRRCAGSQLPHPRVAAEALFVQADPQAVDAREKRIAAELADADAKKAEAQKERDEFRAQERRIRSAAKRASGQGDGRARMANVNGSLDDGRKADLASRAKREAAVQREMQSLSQAVARRAQEEVFSIARKALTDLATASLEDAVTALCSLPDCRR